MGKFCDLYYKERLKQCNENLTVCEKNNEVLRLKISDLEKKLKDKDSDSTAIVELMEKGPGPPKKPVCVLTGNLMIEKVTRVFGDIYLDCPSKLWSDSDWLLGQIEDVQLYLDYYSMFWLPKIRPYTILDWTMLDGTTKRIWVRDCDDFTDFLVGINVLHLPWCGFPWGMMWADVDGWIDGYHAFGWTIAANSSFNEKSINGLDLYLIEPQGKNSYWVPTRDAKVKVTEVNRFVAQPAANYTVTSMSVIKA